jgi:hypothetical protein
MPSRKQVFTVAFDFQKLYSSTEEKELQQRELLRTFTLFPFNVHSNVNAQPKFCSANVGENKLEIQISLESLNL